MTRTLSLARLVAVLVAAFALAGALPATRYAALAQDVPPESEATADAGGPPVEESAPPEGEPDPTAEPPEEVPADDPGEVGDTGESTEGGEAGEGVSDASTPVADPPVEETEIDEAPGVEVSESADALTEDQSAAGAATDFVAADVSVTVVATDGTNPVGGGTYDIFTDLGGGVIGNFVAEVVDADLDGTAVFAESLASGNYVLFVQQEPAGFFRPANQSFTVGDEPVSLQVVFTAGVQGSFRVRKFASSVADENLLGGSCFDFYQDLDPDPGEIVRGVLIANNCDINDQDPGLVLGRNQFPGDFVAVETTTPTGFLSAPDQEFTVVAGQETPVNIVDLPAQGNEPGSILVTKREPFQDLLVDACFELFNDTDADEDAFAAGTQVGSEVCDDDDGVTNAVTTFTNLPPGQYVLVETVAPEGFDEAADREVIVLPGQTTNVTVIDQPLPDQSSFEFFKGFEDGDLPEGEEACFEFFNDLDPDEGEIDPDDSPFANGCTDEDGGVVLSRFQGDGNYVAIETTTPNGYRTAPPTEFSIDGLEIVTVTVFNKLADPTDPATLHISKLGFVSGVNSSPLAGACFRLFEDDDGERGDPVTDVVCDDDDGDDDALISLTAQPGDYVLGEVVVPSGFDADDDTLVTLEPGQVHAISVTNFEDDGVSSFIFFKEFEGGPLPAGEEACFEFRVDLDEDPGEIDPGDLLTGGTGLCTDEDGEVLSRNQEPGFYVAIEVVTPDGYQTADPIEFVIEDVEDDIEISMFNELIPAPTQPPGPTATTEVTELPSTGAGSAADGQALLLLVLIVLGIGATGWGMRRAVRRAA